MRRYAASELRGKQSTPARDRSDRVFKTPTLSTMMKLSLTMILQGGLTTVTVCALLPVDDLLDHPCKRVFSVVGSARGRGRCAFCFLWSPPNMKVCPNKMPAERCVKHSPTAVQTQTTHSHTHQGGSQPHLQTVHTDWLVLLLTRFHMLHAIRLPG